MNDRLINAHTRVSAAISDRADRLDHRNKELHDTGESGMESVQAGIVAALGGALALAVLAAVKTPVGKYIGQITGL